MPRLCSPLSLLSLLLACTPSGSSHAPSGSSRAPSGPSRAPSAGSVAPLCGTWDDGHGTRERWWPDGDGLAGEGRVTGESGEATTEQLALVATEGGHAYVARPHGARATRFEPIDPRHGRYPVSGAPADVPVWLWADYDHDFPQEIRYALHDDRLEVVLSGPGDDGPSHVAWTFERVEACGSGPASGDSAAASLTPPARTRRMSRR